MGCVSGSPAERLPQAAQIVYNVPGQSELSVTGLNEGMDNDATDGNATKVRQVAVHQQFLFDVYGISQLIFLYRFILMCEINLQQTLSLHDPVCSI